MPSRQGVSFSAQWAFFSLLVTPCFFGAAAQLSRLYRSCIVVPARETNRQRCASPLRLNGEIFLEEGGGAGEEECASFNSCVVFWKQTTSVRSLEFVAFFSRSREHSSLSSASAEREREGCSLFLAPCYDDARTALREPLLLREKDLAEEVRRRRKGKPSAVEPPLPAAIASSRPRLSYSSRPRLSSSFASPSLFLSPSHTNAKKSKQKTNNKQNKTTATSTPQTAPPFSPLPRRARLAETPPIFLALRSSPVVTTSLSLGGPKGVERARPPSSSSLHAELCSTRPPRR